jgi:hypothetical protein
MKAPKVVQRGQKMLCDAPYSLVNARRTFLRNALTCNKIGRICAERAVPDPSLVALQRFLESYFPVWLYRPYLHVCIRRTGGYKSKIRLEFRNPSRIHAERLTYFTSGLKRILVK